MNLKIILPLEISNEDAVEDSSVLTDDGSLFSESSADLQKADYVSPEDNPLYKYDSDYQRGQWRAFRKGGT